MDRLQQLIFSFYREDPELQERLEPLRSCRMRRSWGSIRIECIDDAHLEELSGLVADLRLPQLRRMRQLRSGSSLSCRSGSSR